VAQVSPLRPGIVQLSWQVGSSLRKRPGRSRSPRSREYKFSPTRLRIPDVMLVSRGPQPEVAVDPPVLVVEILSPDDSYTETQSRAADYLHMGVPCVWIMDPTSRTGRQCIGDAWTAADTLAVPGTSIQANLFQLFADLDED